MFPSTHAAAAPRRVAPCTIPPSPSPSDAYGPVEDEDHILVLGGPGPELMCALLRAGATNVTHLCAHERPEAASASLLIVPRVPSLDWLAAVLPSIRRALTRQGRFAIQAGPLVTTRTQVRRMLTLHGFSEIRATNTTEGLVLSAALRRPV
jgi:hypothetical protein